MKPATGRAEWLMWRPGSDKFRRLLAIILSLFATYGIAYIAISLARGWPGGFGDSFALWSWGRFLGSHPAAAIYDHAALRAAQLTLGLDPGASYPFAYPPGFLLLLWPLGHLSGAVACVLLTMVSLPLYLWAAVGRDWRSLAVLAALAAPTTAIEIASGQTGFLAAALLAGGLRLTGKRPIAAGVLFGLLTYKPQLGLLVPLALVAGGQWRTIAAAGLTTLAVSLAAILAFGAAVWPAWAAAVPAFSQQFAAERSQVLHLMPTVQAALLQAGAAPAFAQATQWVVSAVAAAAVWALYRTRREGLAGAGLMLAALLATPYAFVYDMPILSMAVMWIVGERYRAGDAFGAGEVLTMLVAMGAPIALVMGRPWGSPVVVLSLVLLLVLTLRRSFVITAREVAAAGAARLRLAP